MPKSFFRNYWKTILVCVVIFILSTITFKSIPKVAKFESSDKVTHAIMYVALGFIAYFEFIRDKIFRVKIPNLFLKMFLFFVFFGGIIEILQGTFFKPRTCELADWLADIFGLLVGAGLGKLISRNHKPWVSY